MPPRRKASLTLIALIAAIALPTAPAPAQSMIDFGQAASEEFLAGDGPRYRSGYSRPDFRRPNRPRREDTRRWHAEPYPRASNRYVHSSRSIAYVQRLPSSTYYRGTGIFANANPSGGSFISIQPQDDDAWNGRGSGPKFIDVASQRLDRQPIAASGISVHYAGSSKIIRIAPNYRMSAAASQANEDFAALPEEAPAAAHDRAPARASPDRPVPMPEEREAWAPPVSETAGPAAPENSPGAPEPVEAAPAAAAESSAATPALEPWTDEWLRDCVARYDDFDASLGTYVGEDGRRRFCTGDPA